MERVSSETYLLRHCCMRSRASVSLSANWTIDARYQVVFPIELEQSSRSPPVRGGWSVNFSRHGNNERPELSKELQHNSETDKTHPSRNMVGPLPYTSLGSVLNSPCAEMPVSRGFDIAWGLRVCNVEESSA